MEFGFTAEQEGFRRELREFFKAELPPDWFGIELGEDHRLDIWEFTRAMSRKLAAKGWLTLTWPEEYGGQGRPRIDGAIYSEEVTYHRVPGYDMGIGGVSWIGPSLMLFGSEEQKREHLPRIAAGEEYWCTGYSEPSAGSDLAALDCRAVADGDDYVITGQKCWQSGAHVADWCWLAARTDPQAPKHRGISVFLLPMKSEGITVVPRMNMVGFEQLNDVFFDHVRVNGRNRVGEENRGWSYILTALDFERSSVVYPASAKRTLDDLVDYALETRHHGRRVWADPVVRHRLAELASEVEIGLLLAYQMACMEGTVPAHVVAVSRAYGTELMQKASRVGMDILGLGGLLKRGSKWAVLRGRLAHSALYNVSITISGGSSEVSRNIIATRGLGLPR